MKVVINNCYGGFSLSPLGSQRYLELTGQPFYCYKQTKFKHSNGRAEFTRIDDINEAPNIFFYCTIVDQGKIISDFPKHTFNSRNIKRTDPYLIQVVEELGSKASGGCAALEVVEIENGRWFKIDEYDGLETIQYRDIDDEWILAE